jgi:hypothetical protein
MSMPCWGVTVCTDGSVVCGQTYYRTIEHDVLCEDCALFEELVCVREDLTVEVQRDRLLVRRDTAEVTAAPSRGSGLPSRAILNRLRQVRRLNVIASC